MRKKLSGENTSTVIRHSYNGKHRKEVRQDFGKLKYTRTKGEKVRLYFKNVKYNRTGKERYRGIPVKLDPDKKQTEKIDAAV